jgi:hypothetical protein
MVRFTIRNSFVDIPREIVFKSQEFETLISTTLSVFFLRSLPVGDGCVEYLDVLVDTCGSIGCAKITDIRLICWGFAAHFIVVVGQRAAFHLNNLCSAALKAVHYSGLRGSLVTPTTV